MKQFFLFLLLLVFLINGISTAQSKNDLSLHVYGIMAIPEGNFAKDVGVDAIPTRRFGFDIGDKVGLAQNGYGGGVELMSAVWFKGLHWILNFTYVMNTVENTALESVYNDQLSNEDQNVNVELEFGQWINIPIMTGFRYDYQITSRFTVYGLAQAGMNLSRRPFQKAMVDISPTESSSVVARQNILAEKSTFEFARDFGFGAGVGIILHNRLNVGIRYFNLSHPKYEGTRNLSELVFPDIFARKSHILGEERSISMYVLTFGINLF